MNNKLPKKINHQISHVLSVRIQGFYRYSKQFQYKNVEIDYLSIS